MNGILLVENAQLDRKDFEDRKHDVISHAKNTLRPLDLSYSIISNYITNVLIKWILISFHPFSKVHTRVNLNTLKLATAYCVNCSKLGHT